MKSHYIFIFVFICAFKKLALSRNFETQKHHELGSEQNEPAHEFHDSFMKDLHALDQERLLLMSALQGFGGAATRRTFKRSDDEVNYSQFLEQLAEEVEKEVGEMT